MTNAMTHAMPAQLLATNLTEDDFSNLTSYASQLGWFNLFKKKGPKDKDDPDVKK